MRFPGSLKTNATLWAATLLVCLIGFTRAIASSAAPASKTTPPTTANHANSKLKSSKAKGSKASVAHKGKHSKKSSRKGQQKIDAERTHQIQEALIRQHYMSGAPSGKWDASTEDALRKFQADNGWQNKTVPDSRALIRLGLGPNHDHLLNPESAMTTTPATPAARTVPTSTPAANGPSAPAGQPQP